VLIAHHRTLKWHFSSLEPDDRGLNETRASACEIVAWRFLTRISQRDAVDFCLYELPAFEAPDDERNTEASNGNQSNTLGTAEANERSRLIPQPRTPDSPRPTTARSLSKRLSKRQSAIRTITQAEHHLFMDDEFGTEVDIEDPTSSFTGLNALEIAAVADAKKFLSQGIVQKIIYGIWTGDITFWESLSVHTTKKAQFYYKRKSDPFVRLRVPKYVKAFEVLFFVTFLALYYAVLIERNPERVTPLEILLYIWIAAFAYDEMSEFVDAGMFYYTDFWSSWDLAIIGVGLAFFITSMAFELSILVTMLILSLGIIGLLENNDVTINTAFDILSLEAIFLLPR
jgi:hypothetical protein